MKKILKYLTVLLVVFSLTSCEEENNFKESEVSLTSVYSISEFSGGSLYKVNVYQKENLIIEYETASIVKKFASSNFSDSSNDTNYMFSVDKIDEAGTAINYTVTADKTTGIGNLTINGTISYNIKLKDEQVYN